jgi:hypothetical protein
MMFSGRVMTLNNNTPTELQWQKLISLILNIATTMKFHSVNVKLTATTKIN